jgi:16S rRNA (guanine527-N7)-methyltransferase
MLVLRAKCSPWALAVERPDLSIICSDATLILILRQIHLTDSPPPPAAFPDDTLAAALARHKFDLPAKQVKKLNSYCHLLWEWNEKINLTRHTDFEKFVTRDVLDSWQLAQLLHPNEDILDVGTGGGVPGVIVAILRPDVNVQVCDSVGKKIKVVDDIVKKLDVDVPVHHTRAEELFQDIRFTAVVARAVGSIAKMCEWFQPHWPMIGRLLTIKGPNWVEERGEARHRGFLRDLELRQAVSYPMPGTESESVILKIWPKGAPEK